MAVIGGTIGLFLIGLRRSDICICIFARSNCREMYTANQVSDLSVGYVRPLFPIILRLVSWPADEAPEPPCKGPFNALSFSHGTSWSP